MLINAMRGHLAELGIVASLGFAAFKTLLILVNDESDTSLPPLAREALRLLAKQIDEASNQIEALEKAIMTWHKGDANSQRLATIPYIGPITASAIAATVGDVKWFPSGRDFVSWLGLVPSQNSTGGKTTQGRITKTGNRYIRTLLVMGATGAIRYAKTGNIPGGNDWLTNLLAKKGKGKVRMVMVALANKMARIAWAVLTTNGKYQAPKQVAA